MSPTATSTPPNVTASPAAPSEASAVSRPHAVGGTDIKSFVDAKSPQSDVQLAAAVAYYHQFEAPEAQRKSVISKDDLIEACRKADRDRPARPDQVLVNAFHEGYLDRPERGRYSINSVGENLVAMVLPHEEDQGSSSGNGSTSRKTSKATRSRKANKK